MIPIVFIHGFLGSSRDWRTVINLLPNSFAIDIPTTDSWSETVDRLNREIPSGSIVCGYSMGARLALGCVLSQPERFRGLVFVSGNPGIANAERKNRLRHDLKMADEITTINIDTFLKKWYQQTVFSGLEPDFLTTLIESKKQIDVQRQAILLTTNSIANQPDYWPRLSQLDLPTILLAGSRDKKYVSICQKMADDIPNCECEIVSNCGHIVHFEQAELLRNQLAEFRQRLSNT